MNHFFGRTIMRLLGAGCFLLLTAHVLAVENTALRLAVVADESQQEKASLITADLSQLSEFEIVERGEIDRILQEQSLSKANLTTTDSLKIGGLLRADALILLQKDLLTIIALRTGLILGQEPLRNPEDLKWVGEILKRSLPKLRVKREDAVALSIVSTDHSAISYAAQETAETFQRLLLLRLEKVPKIFILERQRMNLLTSENTLTGGTDEEFWKATRVLKIQVGPDSLDPSQLAGVFLLSQLGGEPQRWVIQAATQPELIEKAVSKLSAELSVVQSVDIFDAKGESAHFRAKLKRDTSDGTFYNFLLAPRIAETASTLWALGERKDPVWQYVIAAPLLREGCASWDASAMDNFLKQHPDQLSKIMRTLTSVLLEDIPHIESIARGEQPGGHSDGWLCDSLQHQGTRILVHIFQNKITGIEPELAELRDALRKHFEAIRAMKDFAYFRSRMAGTFCGWGRWWYGDFDDYLLEMEKLIAACRTTSQLRGGVESIENLVRRSSRQTPLVLGRNLIDEPTAADLQKAFSRLNGWSHGKDPILRWLAGALLPRHFPDLADKVAAQESIVSALEELAPQFIDRTLSWDFWKWGINVLGKTAQLRFEERLQSIKLRILATDSDPERYAFGEVPADESRARELLAALLASEKRVSRRVMPELQKAIADNFPAHSEKKDSFSTLEFTIIERAPDEDQWKWHRTTTSPEGELWQLASKYEGEVSLFPIPPKTGATIQIHRLPWTSEELKKEKLSASAMEVAAGADAVFIFQRSTSDITKNGICFILNRKSGQWKIIRIPPLTGQGGKSDEDSLIDGQHIYWVHSTVHPDPRIGVLEVDGEAAQWKFHEFAGAMPKRLSNRLTANLRTRQILLVDEETKDASSFPSFSIGEKTWTDVAPSVLTEILVAELRRPPPPRSPGNPLIPRNYRAAVRVTNDQKLRRWTLDVDPPGLAATFHAVCEFKNVPAGFDPHPSATALSPYATWTPEGIFLPVGRHLGFAAWKNLPTTAMPAPPTWLIFDQRGNFSLTDETFTFQRTIGHTDHLQQPIRELRGKTALVRLNRPGLYAALDLDRPGDEWITLDLPLEATPQLAPDGRSLVYLDGDGALVTQALATSVKRTAIPLNGPAWGQLAFSKTGEFVAASGSGKVVISRRDGSEHREFPIGETTEIARGSEWNAGQRYLATLHGTSLTILDTTTGQMVRQLRGVNVFAWDATRPVLLASQEGPYRVTRLDATTAEASTFLDDCQASFLRANAGGGFLIYGYRPAQRLESMFRLGADEPTLEPIGQIYQLFRLNAETKMPSLSP